MIDRFARLATERTRRILLIAGAVFLLAAAIGVPVVTILKSESSDFQDPNAPNQQVLRAVEHATGQAAYHGVAALVPSATGRAHRPRRAGAGHARRRAALAPARLRARAGLPRHAPARARLAQRAPDARARRVRQPRTLGRRRRTRPPTAGRGQSAPGRQRRCVRRNQQAHLLRSGARGDVRPADPAAALLLGLPRADRRRAAAARGWLRDRHHVPAAAPDRPVRRPVGVRRQPRHRRRPGPGHRLQPVHPLPLPRGARARPRHARGDPAHAADRGAHRHVRLADGRRRGRLDAGDADALPLLDGGRWGARGAVGRRGLAGRAARRARRARPAHQRAGARPLAAGRRTVRATGGERRLVPARARGHAPPGRRRAGHRGALDRDRAPRPAPAADPRRRARAARLRTAPPGGRSDYARLRRRWLTGDHDGRARAPQSGPPRWR